MNQPLFTPRDAGTPDGLWTDFLDQKISWMPSTQDVLVIAPHPDDELLGAGGLIRACALAGQRVTVVSVTDGEASDTTRRDLSAVRRSELGSALRTLCPVHVKIERLGIPDGCVARHENRLRNALSDLLTPSVTLVGPLERDGHPDHDAVGQLCLNLASARRLPQARFPIWAWHHSRPDDFDKLDWRIHRLDADARRDKARAINCFKSQLQPLHGDPVLPPHVLTHFERPYEAFVL